MRASIVLLTSLLGVTLASPTPWGGNGHKEQDHSTEDKCENYDLCKDHDWSACRKGWGPKPDHRRRDGWEKDDKGPHGKESENGHREEHDDWCKNYEVCKDHDWKECKPHHEDKHNDGHKDNHEDECKPDHGDDWSFPFTFTSYLVAHAGPDQVVNNSDVPVFGLPDGYGLYKFGLNSHEDVICYNISIYLKGEYQSPANTATHIHQAGEGKAGPPRIAFPNPEPRHGEGWDEYAWRYSYGCLWGPFETGVVNDDIDTGSGFTVQQLEDDPSGFFADVHTSDFPAGAVRGQIYHK